MAQPRDKAYYAEVAAILNAELGASLDGVALWAASGELHFTAHHPDYIRDDGEDDSDAAALYLWPTIDDAAVPAAQAPQVTAANPLLTFEGYERTHAANRRLLDFHLDWSQRFQKPGRRARLSPLSV